MGELKPLTYNYNLSKPLKNPCACNYLNVCQRYTDKIKDKKKTKVRIGNHSPLAHAVLIGRQINLIQILISI